MNAVIWSVILISDSCRIRRAWDGSRNLF